MICKTNLITRQEKNRTFEKSDKNNLLKQIPSEAPRLRFPFFRNTNTVEKNIFNYCIESNSYPILFSLRRVNLRFYQEINLTLVEYINGQFGNSNFANECFAILSQSPNQ